MANFPLQEFSWHSVYRGKQLYENHTHLGFQ